MEDTAADEEEIILYTVLLGLLGLGCSYLLYRRISASDAPAPTRKPSGIPAHSKETAQVSVGSPNNPPRGAV